MLKCVNIISEKGLNVQIYIDYGQENEEYLSYSAPVIPRVGEKIQYVETVGDGSEEQTFFKVLEIRHWTDGDHYDVTIRCMKMVGKRSR